jgi:hypothetical protein
VATSPVPQPSVLIPVAPAPSPTEAPPNPLIVADAKKDALPLAKKAFDDHLDYEVVVGAYWKANEERLRKKYGDDGSSDYIDALDEAAKQEFNRLLEAAIGPKPTEEGDYDKDLSNRVYWNVFAHVEKSLKDDLNDPKSYQRVGYPEFMLTQYKGDWAWGATLDYRAKNAFGALMKDSLNIYVAKNGIIDVQHGEPSMSERELQRALEENQKTKAKRNGHN